MNEGRQKEFLMTQEDFAFIAQLAYRETGIVLAEHKRDMVYSRLTKRLRQLNLPSFRHYCEYLRGDGIADELLHLVNAITTNLTSFFRENHHFEHLEKEALLPILTKKPNARIRIWSAGCSQGCEPYSIAMVVASLLERFSGADIKILATDIDTNMLARGRSGEYRADDAKSIPARFQKYVQPNKREGESGVIMAPALRKLITFNQLNLLQDNWPMRGVFDIIFCRNVVIYFDKDTQKILFQRYAKQSSSHAWLYIGHSESLFNVCDLYKLHGKTIYKKAS